MRHIAVVFAAITLLTACGSPVAPAPPSDNSVQGSGAGAGPASSSTQGVVAKNIGDVEQTVFVNLKLAERSRSPRILQEAKADALERVRLLTLDLLPPFPEELWLDAECQCREKYDDTPVVVRGTYLIDGRATEEKISIVLAKHSEQTHALPSVELMRLIGPPPDSVLVTLDLEGLLMPMGTDPATIDPWTAKTTPDRTSRAVLGTTVRINFQEAGLGEPAGPAGPALDPAALSAEGERTSEPAQDQPEGERPASAP